MTTAVSDLISLPKGTFGIRMSFTVYDNDGTAHDLTTITGIKFQVWKSGVPGTLVVDGTVTKLVDADGTCYYDIVSGSFDTPGRYLWQLELTKASYEDHTDAAPLVITEAG